MEKLVLIYMKLQKTPNSQNNLDHIRSLAKLRKLIKAASDKDRRWIDEGTEINLYINGQLISCNGTKTIYWGKSSLFRWYWDNWMTTGKRMKLELYLIYLCLSLINSKLVNNL